jgi:hypothetical protein
MRQDMWDNHESFHEPTQLQRSQGMKVWTKNSTDMTDIQNPFSQLNKANESRM